MRSVILFRASALISAFALSANFIWAQCDTWNNKPNMEDLVQEHVVYKAFLKEGKFDEAFPYWERVYKAAPYADGKRADHFYDGQQFYIRFHQAAGTDADKAKFTEYIGHLRDVVLAIRMCPVPTIAAVNGVAPAGGTVLMLL